MTGISLRYSDRDVYADGYGAGKMLDQLMPMTEYLRVDPLAFSLDDRHPAAAATVDADAISDGETHMRLGVFKVILIDLEQPDCLLDAHPHAIIEHELGENADLALGTRSNTSEARLTRSV